MTRRRRRVRAADLARPNARKTLPALGAVIVALSLLLLYKVNVGDDATDLLVALGMDPALTLPQTVSDQSPVGVVAEGAIAALAALARDAQAACPVPPPAVGRLTTWLAVEPSGRLRWLEAGADPGASVPPGVAACVQRFLADRGTIAPLAGEARVRLMIPVLSMPSTP